ncbi:MAG: hypothetical protein HYW88_00130, partial [Candidatus Sungbacteria bacterium]|nr:hypothetical protein [Candidatus Sungbacteria bacterium]
MKHGIEPSLPEEPVFGAKNKKIVYEGELVDVLEDDYPEDEEAFTPLPEERERFEGLISRLNDCLNSSLGTFFEFEKDFTDFLSDLSEAGKHGLEHAISERELWFDMMAEGGRFRKYFFQKFKSVLDSEKFDQSLAYHYITVAEALDEKETPLFLANVLTHPSVWQCKDGSSAHSILEILERNSETCPNAAEAIGAYIKNIFSEDYQRTAFRDSDAKQAAQTLFSIQGEAAKETLAMLAEENLSLFCWFEKLKLCELYFAEQLPPLPKKDAFVFDSQTELKNLQILRENFKNKKFTDFGHDS